MHSICGPIGGFTQHIRWLLLMSPNYNSLDKLNYTSAVVYGKRFPLKSEDKVNFIKEHIYPSDRRCFNWLSEKYMYREVLDKTLLHTHDLSKINNEPAIIITMDPYFSYNFYLKFTPNISLDRQGFIDQVTLQNEQNTEYANTHNNCLLIDTQSLYSPILDRKIYDDMISFLSIENVYDSAQAIHKLWYDLRKGSEEDILNFAMNSKFPEYPWTYKIGCPVSEYEHEQLKLKLLEVYGE
jgi:hypothetical protein